MTLNWVICSSNSPNIVAENEYESMTSIRNSVWTPTDNAGGKTIDGLSSPSVIIQDQSHPSAKDDSQVAPAVPIEPPPNFSSNSSKDNNAKQTPPPVPTKKYTIKPNKHETQFHATLQRSAKTNNNNNSSQNSPKMEAKKTNNGSNVNENSSNSTPKTSSNGKVIIQPSQVRMASMQAAQEIKQRQQRSKRIRNRSLEMVLDENRSSDSSPSRKR